MDDVMLKKEWSTDGQWYKCADRRAPQRATLHHSLSRCLKTLDLRKRRQHDCRRTFISLAQADGARKDFLRWVTHGPTGDIIDIYTTLPWDALCAEVSKLRVEIREGRILELRQVAGAACYSPCDSDLASTQKPPRLINLEALVAARSTGLEPVTSGVTGASTEGPTLPKDSQVCATVRVGTIERVQASQPFASIPKNFVPPLSPNLRAIGGRAEDLLAVRDVAAQLRLSRSTIYKLCDRNELLHIRISNAIRIAPADLAAFIRRHRSRGLRQSQDA